MEEKDVDGHEERDAVLDFAESLIFFRVKFCVDNEE